MCTRLWWHPICHRLPLLQDCDLGLGSLAAALGSNGLVSPVPSQRTQNEQENTERSVDSVTRSTEAFVGLVGPTDVKALHPKSIVDTWKLSRIRPGNVPFETLFAPCMYSINGDVLHRQTGIRMNAQTALATMKKFNADRQKAHDVYVQERGYQLDAVVKKLISNQAQILRVLAQHQEALMQIQAYCVQNTADLNHTMEFATKVAMGTHQSEETVDTDTLAVSEA